MTAGPAGRAAVTTRLSPRVIAVVLAGLIVPAYADVWLRDGAP